MTDELTSDLDIHNSDDRLEYVGHVDMFYLTKGLWEEKSTTGEPPLGIWGYSCTSIDKRLCFFGGGCGHEPIEDVCDGYHNSINVLDTNTLHWQQLSPTTDDNVMRRANGGMISFSCDNEDLTFIIGGSGPLPKLRQPHASYHESSASLLNNYTNECNIFNITTSNNNIEHAHVHALSKISCKILPRRFKIWQVGKKSVPNPCQLFELARIFLILQDSSSKSM